MALTTIASPSKSENLIYTLLPLSVGLWILTFVSLVTVQDSGIPQPLPDLTQSLALVGVFVSILSLVLLETGLDEYIVKFYYRRSAGSRSFSQRYSFLIWRWILRTWAYETVQAPYPRVDGIDYIKTQVDVAVKATVSSPLVEKRLWRIRGSFYLFLAALFFFWSASIAVSIAGILITDIGTLISALGPLSMLIPIALVFRDNWLVALCVFWIVQLVANWNRHKNLREHIEYASQLHFARTSRAVLSVSTLGAPTFQAEAELEILDELLSDGNWSWFADRFTRITESLRDWIIDSIEKNGFFDLVHQWAYLADHYIEDRFAPDIRRIKILEEKAKLGWLVYYYAALCELKSEYGKKRKQRVEFPFPKFSKEEWAFIEWMRTFWIKGLPNHDKPEFMLTKLVETLDAPKKNVRIIKALMRGLYKNKNEATDVAEKVGTVALLRGELRDKLPDPSLADKALIKYFCGVKNADKTVIETASIEEMTRLYGLDIASSDCWKDILLFYIEKGKESNFNNALDSAYLKDFLADKDIEQALRARSIG